MHYYKIKTKVKNIFSLYSKIFAAVFKFLFMFYDFDKYLICFLKKQLRF